MAISTGTTAAEKEATAEHESRAASPFRLNSIGYLNDASKVAVVAVGREGATFLVREVSTGKEIYRGQLSAAVRDGDTNEKLYRADFSTLRIPGRYQLQLLDGPSSPAFSIGNDVYNWPFFCAMRAMYLCRCGIAVDCEFAGQKFGHAVCHAQDGYLDYVGGPASGHRDGTGGWHDAGDYNKYTVNSAFTVGMMLRAWEDHKDRLAPLRFKVSRVAGNVPDYLDEIRWELEWLLKMQADDGSVYHKLSALKFCGYVMPEADRVPRYFSSWGSAATADFAAVAAQAARIYQPYDAKFSDRCLAAAEKAYAFLEQHPEFHRPDLRAFSMGGYESNDAGERLWAAAELWESTGKPRYLADFEEHVSKSLLPSRDGRQSIKDVWDWSDVRNLGVFTYVASKREGRAKDVNDLLLQAVISSATRIAGTARLHPYNRPLGDTYYWGGNGSVARQAMNLNSAIGLVTSANESDKSKMISGSTCQSTTLDGLNYLFGKNPYGRSFVSGLGHNPPQNPHDRRSVADNVKQPWPGYLVGGPWPKATDWHDDQDDYKTNEVAINWNGALIYALAAFIEPTTFDASIANAERAAENAANSSDKPPAATASK